MNNASQMPKPIVSSQGFEYGVKHFYTAKTAQITEILFDVLNIQADEAEDLLNLGAIYVNNQRAKKNEQLNAGCLLRVHSKPRRYNCAHNWKNLIIFEDEDFVVLNKPSNIPSHPSVDNALENSLSQLSLAINSDLHITHRLDTLTSGLIVYAKNQNFVKNFNQQLQQQNTEKKYVALVESTAQLPKKVIHYMEPSPRAPKKVSAAYVESWAFCELDIIEQKKYNEDLIDTSWVKINLLTGRTHQIRAQLSQLQAPIVGDSLYGAKQKYLAGGIALRACELEFTWLNKRLKFNLSEEF